MDFFVKIDENIFLVGKELFVLFEDIGLCILGFRFGFILYFKLDFNFRSFLVFIY